MRLIQTLSCFVSRISNLHQYLKRLALVNTKQFQVCNGSKPDSIPTLDSRTGETIERTLQETCDSVQFHCPCTPITFNLECFQTTPRGTK